MCIDINWNAVQAIVGIVTIIVFGFIYYKQYQQQKKILEQQVDLTLWKHRFEFCQEIIKFCEIVLQYTGAGRSITIYHIDCNGNDINKNNPYAMDSIMVVKLERLKVNLDLLIDKNNIYYNECSNFIRSFKIVLLPALQVIDRDFTRSTSFINIIKSSQWNNYIQTGNSNLNMSIWMEYNGNNEELINKKEQNDNEKIKKINILQKKYQEEIYKKINLLEEKTKTFLEESIKEKNREYKLSWN